MSHCFFFTIHKFVFAYQIVVLQKLRQHQKIKLRKLPTAPKAKTHLSYQRSFPIGNELKTGIFA
jgi:hypothetical protein